jgi:formylmethanofuran dehydrogenase subunit A
MRQAGQSGRRRSLEAPRQRQRHTGRSVVDHFDVTPRQIIRELAPRRSTTWAAAFGPHPLQQPGHARQLADHARDDESPRRASRPHHAHPVPQLRRRRGRRNHVQLEKVQPLADYVNSHPNITVDVGQVLFGETTSMTGDGPLGYYLHNVYGTKWFSADTEWKPAAASPRSSTATRAWSTPGNGRSGWSGTCWSRTRGAW